MAIRVGGMLTTRGLPSAQELFATVTIGGWAGMRLNMYNSHVHPHKYTAIVRFRLNCWWGTYNKLLVGDSMLNCWWEATPVGSHLPPLVGVSSGGN